MNDSDKIPPPKVTASSNIKQRSPVPTSTSPIPTKSNNNNNNNNNNKPLPIKKTSFSGENISIDSDDTNSAERTSFHDSFTTLNSLNASSDVSNTEEVPFISETNINNNNNSKFQTRFSSSSSPTKKVSPSHVKQEYDLQSEFEDLPHVDELVQEYLLYRGFTRTFHRFQEDRKADQLLGLNVARIVDQLFAYIHRYDMPGLLSLWSFLNARFFYHLDSNFRSVVLEFELALKRYYVINTIQTNRKEEAVNFFKEYCAELNISSGNNDTNESSSFSTSTGSNYNNTIGNIEMSSEINSSGNNNMDENWKGWFALPFLPNPERSTQFHKYFDPSWSNTLAISLRNFLNLILQNTPLPKLMAFNIGRVQRYEQECIIESQKAEIRLLKKQLLQRDQGKKKKNTDIIGDMISKTGLDEAGDIDLNEKEAKAKVKQNDKDIIIIDNGNDDNTRKLPFESVISDKKSNTSKLSEIFSSVDNSNNQTRGKLDENDLLANIANMNARKYDIIHTETLIGHNDSVLCCKFSNDGYLIASGGADCTVRIWDLKSWQDSLHVMGATLSQYDKNDTTLEMDDDGMDQKGIDSITKDDTTTVENNIKEYNFWNAAHDKGNNNNNSQQGINMTNNNVSPSHVPCHSTIYLSSEALCMDWTTYGQRKNPLLLFGTANREVKVWDVNQNDLTAEFETDHLCPNVQCVRYIPSVTNCVVIASNNRNNTYGKLETWDITRKSVVCHLDLGRENIVVNTMDVDDAGEKLIVGCSDGDIRLYDLRGSPVLMQRWKAHETGNNNGVGGVTGVTLTHDGQVISSGGLNNEMVMWDIRNREGVGIIRQYLTDDDDNSVRKHEMNNNFYAKSSRVSWAWADKKTLIRSSENGSAVLHRLARQRPVQYLHGHNLPVLSVSWTIAPGCPLNSCATSSLDNTLKLWALKKI